MAILCIGRYVRQLVGQQQVRLVHISKYIDEFKKEYSIDHNQYDNLPPYARMDRFSFKILPHKSPEKELAFAKEYVIEDIHTNQFHSVIIANTKKDELLAMKCVVDLNYENSVYLYYIDQFLNA